MSLVNLEELSFTSFLNSNGLCTDALENVFGNSLDWNWIEKIKINEVERNLWVWRHHSHRASIASTVYDHDLDFKSFDEPWLGWPIIWKPPMMPRIKFFLWKLAHGRLSTGDCLYHINIGPKISYPLCGLVDETMAHLFWNFNKILHCWYEVFSRIG